MTESPGRHAWDLNVCLNGELAQSHLQNPDVALWGTSDVGAGRSKGRRMRQVPRGSLCTSASSMIAFHYMELFYLLYFYIQTADTLVKREVRY